MTSSIASPHEKDLQIIENNKDLSFEDHKHVSYKSKVCLKPWGYEFLVFESSRIGIWCLTVYEHHKTSMHCHFKKDTWITVLHGCAKIDLFNETKILNPMESLLIPKHTFHSLGSFSPSTTILEIEVFQNNLCFSDKNDLLRVDDQYKRKPVGYETSVDILTENLEKYNYFALDDSNIYKIHNMTLEKKIISTRQQLESLFPFQKLFLLSGSVLIDSIYMKEGSLINSSSISKLILIEPIEVLCLKKIDYQEDSKIIYGFDHLTQLVKQMKQNKETIILTSGCFDILHVGHIQTLKQAKSLGTKLIVCLSSDKQIKELKGSNRPINNNEDRLNLFKIINYVDYIMPYEEENIPTEGTLGNIMKLVDPDYWVKGTDYTKEAILKKHPYLRNIALIDIVEEKSTTNIIQKILNS